MAYMDLINQYVNSAPVPGNFIKEFGGFNDFWKNTASPYYKPAVEKDVFNYINPLRKTAQQGVRSNLARRGLFRSTLLDKNLKDTNANYDEQRDLRTESLLTNRAKEARGAYDSLWRVYEDDPTGARKRYQDLLNSYKIK